MKVLFATPLSAAGADSNYLRTMVSALLLKEPSIELEFASSDCGCVGFARNELGHMAEEGGFDRILWVDDDMLLRPEHIIRILSHDVDLVSGAYCKRRPGKPQWLFVPKKGAEVQSNGMLECVRLATGIQSLKVSCLTGLRKAFPDQEFLAQESPDSPPQVRMNYYRMGVHGPRTAEARLERVKAALETWHKRGKGAQYTYDALHEIGAACYDEQPPGTLYGEDYWNAKMLRDAGYRIYVDLGMPIIHHLGIAPYPITPEMVGFTPGAPMVLPMAEEG